MRARPTPRSTRSGCTRSRRLTRSTASSCQAFEDGILHNAQWRKDIAGADVITLSIGSNGLDIDLVKYEIGGCDKTCVDSTLAAFEAQYARTLDELRAMTEARITVLDIYDPLPALIDDYVRGKLADINAFIHRYGMRSREHDGRCRQPGIQRRGRHVRPKRRGLPGVRRHTPERAGRKVIAAAVAMAHC